MDRFVDHLKRRIVFAKIQISIFFSYVDQLIQLKNYVGNILYQDKIKHEIQNFKIKRFEYNYIVTCFRTCGKFLKFLWH